MKDETIATASSLPFESWVAQSLAALLFVPLFCPPLHGAFRKAVRPWVLFHVERGVDRVQQLQRLRTPLLTSLCSWTSLTVSVEFYVTFLPVLIWAVHPQLGWRLVFLLAFGLYVGNAMKDLVSAPRPLAVFDAKGEAKVLAHLNTAELKSSAKEYGLPSTHTLNSCLLNYYVIYFCLERGLIAAETGRTLYVVASCWIAFIAFARLYLGMHTPIDVLGGMLGGAAVLNFFITIDDPLEEFIVSQPPVRAIACLLLGAIVVLRGHPRPMRHTPSFEYSTSFVAVAFGMGCALTKSYDKLIEDGTLLPRLWSIGGWWVVLRRVLVGFLAVASLATIARRVMLVVVPPLYIFFPVRLRRLWQPPMHHQGPPSPLTKQGIPSNDKGRPWDVDLTSRFAAFATLGWVVVAIRELFEVLQW
mmetsp:Transcript_2266/g.6741  ORF Transcript_2266/g.6741 Transcript_2266/m.6741 type:complete len:416 (-) Transcript_2266:957-2204(-)